MRYCQFLAPLPVAIVVLSMAFTSTYGDEVLRNTSFEQWAGKRPDLWAANGLVEQTTTARSGRSALKLGPGGRVLQCFPLEGGVAYHGSVWVRGEGRVSLSFYEYKDGPGQGYTSAAGSKSIPAESTWRQLHLFYSQGPNEAHLKGLCFAISVSGDAAEVLLDDASVEKSPMPAEPANLLRKLDFQDADGDGMPDGWRGEQRRLRTERTPSGIPCVRCDATLFSEDFMPDPSFKDWWHWPRWGEQHGSGWPALPRPLGGAYTVLLESEPVAVQPGKRYDVGLLLREQGVYGEFIGVRWFDADKKAKSGERIGYYHMSGHTGDWVRYLGRTTAPSVARYAAVIVGAKLSSGTVWVAKPSLTFGIGAPYRHKPRADRKPAEISQGVPKPKPAAPKPLEAKPPGTPGVEVTQQKIAITFAHGIRLELPLRNKRMVGITSVSVGDTLLRSPKAFPVAPLIQTEPARSYSECIYEGWDKQGNGIVIHSTLQVSNGDSDKLDWIIEPVRQTLADRPYVGLRYGYRFTSDKVRVMRIMDRATWELGGQSIGTRIGPGLRTLGKSSTYCLGASYRFVGGESFGYQTSAADTMVTLLDHYHTSLLMRAATPDFIISQDTFLFPEVSQAATTGKCVLVTTDPGSADDWARIRDQLYARYRQQLGAPPERPLEPACMILGWSGFRGVGNVDMGAKKPTRPEYYRWVAEKAVPCLAKLGFKRVMIVLGMAPLDWPAKDLDRLCPDYEQSFKHLCDVARKHGMGVIIWYATGQNKNGSPVWKEHPEFILWGPNGQRASAYYSPDGWPGNLASGYFQYTLEGLRDMKRRTGLDGLWLDSYASATHLPITGRFSDCVHQADSLLPWQAAVEKMGLYTYCEGHPTCLGTISSSGWRPPDDWSRFQPEGFYKQGLYLQQAYTRDDAVARFLIDPDRHHYYRFLANMCCPILDMGHLGTDAAAIGRIAQANHDFNAVSDLMRVRRLLGKTGVEWMSQAGQAVFAFEPFVYTVPPDRHVRDVTIGQDVLVPADRRIKLTPYHTYRLTPM